MGGKLSDIQKTILILCMEKGFLTCQEILRQVFVGRDYNLAHVTMSRTLSRLWSKNLITIWKTLSRQFLAGEPDGKNIGTLYCSI